MALTGQTIRVNLTGTQITASSPVSLRNTAADYNAIDKLSDVDVSSRADGSTLVYNATTDKYEVKPLSAAITELDGGTF